MSLYSNLIGHMCAGIVDTANVVRLCYSAFSRRGSGTHSYYCALILLLQRLITCVDCTCNVNHTSPLRCGRGFCPLGEFRTRSTEGFHRRCET